MGGGGGLRYALVCYCLHHIAMAEISVCDCGGLVYLDSEDIRKLQVCLWVIVVNESMRLVLACHLMSIYWH